MLPPFAVIDIATIFDVIAVIDVIAASSSSELTSFSLFKTFCRYFEIRNLIADSETWIC